MPAASTVLTAQLEVGANLVTLSSVTNIAAGMFANIDGEQVRVSKNYVAGTNPVLLDMRGMTTLNQIHVVGSRFIFAIGTDFANPAPTVLTTLSEYPAMDRQSIFAAGALPIPSTGRNLHVQIVATAGAIALTLANPTADMDGCVLIISSIAKLAHTVTYTAGLGNVGATADVLTFSATQTQSCQLIAEAGFWNGLSGLVAGAATIVGVGVA